jgi:tRNA (guanosine-2'-O-)-methyltransferase
MVPMAGMVRSLNLSVTAALVLYEVTRQRRLAGMERYLLPPEERARIVGRWLARESN